MTKQKKTIFAVAGALVVVGMVIGAVGYVVSKGNGNGEHMEEFTKTYPANIEEIQVDADLGDVKVYPAEGEEIIVTYYDNEKQRYSITNQNQNLTITRREHKNWYEYLAIQWGKNFYDECSIGIPQSYGGDLRIKVTTGDIGLSDLAFKKELTLTGTTGSIRLYRTQTEGNLSGVIATGDLVLEDVTIGQNLDMRATTGDLKASNVICSGSANIGATTGDIRLNKMSANSYNCKITTGDIHFDALKAEEKASFEAITGDIRGTIDDDETLFAISGQTAVGDIDLPQSISTGTKQLQAKTVTGDIRITFFK